MIFLEFTFFSLLMSRHAIPHTISRGRNNYPVMLLTVDRLKNFLPIPKRMRTTALSTIPSGWPSQAFCCRLTKLKVYQLFDMPAISPLGLLSRHGPQTLTLPGH